jgi:hypothetical protein
MKKFLEIFKYGDSEPLEIILSFVLIAQLCYPSPSIFCWHFVIPDYYYFLGVASGIGLLFGNIIGNITIRKWSANAGFIILLGVLVFSLYSGFSSIQFYAIIFSEFLALFWITWRCSREEVLHNLKTKKNIDND